MDVGAFNIAAYEVIHVDSKINLEFVDILDKNSSVDGSLCGNMIFIHCWVSSKPRHTNNYEWGTLKRRCTRNYEENALNRVP
jgi:hypothetical protein